MANELSVTAAMLFAKNGIEQIGRTVTARQIAVAGNGGVYEAGLSIATSETVIKLGELTAPFGYVWFHNLDSTNFIQIKIAASGTIIVKLLAGEVACLRLGSGISAPVAIADTAACLLEYWILPP